MQCNDIRFLGADVCQLGLDQRKVNMLARDQAGAMGLARPPVILSHPMMPGLKEGQAKMSNLKSHPDTAIFMEDSREDVARKIAKAHCPPGVEEGNPCLVYLKCIVFPFAVKAGRPVVITDERTGVVAAAYDTYRALADAYVGGSVHPKDLKACLVAELNGLLEPTRRHFATNPATCLLAHDPFLPHVELGRGTHRNALDILGYAVRKRVPLRHSELGEGSMPSLSRFCCTVYASSTFPPHVEEYCAKSSAHGHCDGNINAPLCVHHVKTSTHTHKLEEKEYKNIYHTDYTRTESHAEAPSLGCSPHGRRQHRLTSSVVLLLPQP